MKNFFIIASAALLAYSLSALHAQSGPPATEKLSFTGAVDLIATENNPTYPKRPSMLVLTVTNSAGERIKFCNSALHPWNLAISATNPQIKGIQESVTHSKSAHKHIVGVATEDTTDSDGLYCGIQSVSEAP